MSQIKKSTGRSLITKVINEESLVLDLPSTIITKLVGMHYTEEG